MSEVLYRVLSQVGPHDPGSEVTVEQLGGAPALPRLISLGVIATVQGDPLVAVEVADAATIESLNAANDRVTDLERQLGIVTKERDKALSDFEELKRAVIKKDGETAPDPAKAEKSALVEKARSLGISTTAKSAEQLKTLIAEKEAAPDPAKQGA